MAKVSFTKLSVKKVMEEIPLNINGETILVQSYLPIEKKSELIKSLIASVIDDDAINSPIRNELYTVLYLIKYYTNINFTDAMMNAAEKTYDLLQINGIVDAVMDVIPENELNLILDIITESIDSICTYRQSAAGILASTNKDFQATDGDVGKLVEQLQGLTDSSMLKDVLTNFS